MAVGSEACSLQFDVAPCVSFLIHFCFQESWEQQPLSAREGAPTGKEYVPTRVLRGLARPGGQT